MNLIGWHRYFVGAAVNIWYSSGAAANRALYRCWKKSRKKIGTAAIGALLAPAEWILLLLYSIFKESPEDTYSVDRPRK